MIRYGFWMLSTFLLFVCQYLLFEKFRKTASLYNQKLARSILKLTKNISRWLFVDFLFKYELPLQMNGVDVTNKELREFIFNERIFSNEPSNQYTMPLSNTHNQTDTKSKMKTTSSNIDMKKTSATTTAANTNITSQILNNKVDQLEIMLMDMRQVVQETPTIPKTEIEVEALSLSDDILPMLQLVDEVTSHIVPSNATTVNNNNNNYNNNNNNNNYNNNDYPGRHSFELSGNFSVGGG